MTPLLKSLFAPFLSLVLLILASGLCNTFISLRLEAEGYPSETIGFVAATLYLGIFVGSLWMDRWIARWGHVRAFVASAGCIAFLTLIQALWIDPYYWGILRFAGGICTAGIFIVIESWLLMQANPSVRGVMLSIYLAMFYLALSLGQLLIHVSDPLGNGPFYIISFLATASILPLVLKDPKPPKMTSAAPLNTLKLFQISPLGLTGVIISGITLAAIYGLVPVYAKEIGFSISEVGNLMAFLIFGGLVFQWPLCKLADRSSRRHVLLASGLLTAFFGCIIALVGDYSPLLLFLLAFLFGGFSFTIYPLSMAHACEKVTENQLVSATGGFVLAYGMGAIAGPLVAPVAMTCFGSCGLFYFLAGITAFLVLVGILQKKPQAAEICIEPEKAPPETQSVSVQGASEE